MMMMMMMTCSYLLTYVACYSACIAMQTSSSGSGSSSTADSPHCSDLYFDDEFSSERIMSRDRHLRLQTTLGLDRPATMNLSEEFHSPVVLGGRARVHHKMAGQGAAASGNTSTATGQKIVYGRAGTAASYGEGKLHS